MLNSLCDLDLPFIYELIRRDIGQDASNSWCEVLLLHLADLQTIEFR
jgi:hypothetical protein